MSHTYMENRIAYTNAVRQVALDPLTFRGVPVTELQPGDSVSFKVYFANQLYQAAQNAVYSAIFTDRDGHDHLAWNGVVTCPPTPGQLKIVWTLSVDLVQDFVVDYIDVIALP